MPGHKNGKLLFPRQSFPRDEYGGLYLPARLDTTELSDTDNLHLPTGKLKALNETLSRIYGSQASRLITTGSTTGILSAVLGVRRSSGMLTARNCHKSVYHALLLGDIVPTYLYPQQNKFGFYADFSIADIESSLQRLTSTPPFAAIFTYPTYEGFYWNLEEVISCVKKHLPSTLILVDEAHGAHSPFLSEKTALSCGADIVIQSLHKTLPVLGGASVLHYGRGIDAQRMRRIDWHLSALQTSSPSYLIMTSVEDFFQYVEESLVEEGLEALPRLFAARLWRMRRLKDRLSRIHPDLILIENEDPFKILLRYRHCRKLGDYLEKEHGIYCEIVNAEYLLAMSGMADSQEEADGFLSALTLFFERENVHIAETEEKDSEKAYRAVFNPVVMTPGEAHERYLSGETQTLVGKYSEGRIAAEFVTPYPPGIPMLVPGERISAEMATWMNEREVSVVKEASDDPVHPPGLLNLSF